MVKAGIGTSSLPGGSDAASEAATMALASLGAGRPGLLVVFSSVSYQLDEVVAAVRRVGGQVPLVGATSAGQIFQGQLIPVGAGVVVAALGTERQFTVASVSGLRADPYQAGMVLARAALESAGTAPTSQDALLLFADGLAGDHQQLVRGIYRVAGPAVPVVGAAASDDRILRRTSVFRDDQVLSDAAVAVLIRGTEQPGIGFGHGWRPQGDPMVVTRVRGSVVVELDGRPAAEVYMSALDALGQPRSEIRFATAALDHPLGILQPDGNFSVRSLLRLTEEGGIAAFAGLPELAVVHVMTTDVGSLLQGAEGVVDSALAAGDDPALVLAFSCVARYDILGPEVAAEALGVQKAAGEVPTVGFYTYGEFARTRGVIGFHNATMTALAL